MNLASCLSGQKRSWKGQGEKKFCIQTAPSSLSNLKTVSFLQGTQVGASPDLSPQDLPGEKLTPLSPQPNLSFPHH